MVGGLNQNINQNIVMFIV